MTLWIDKGKLSVSSKRNGRNEFCNFGILLVPLLQTQNRHNKSYFSLHDSPSRREWFRLCIAIFWKSF